MRQDTVQSGMHGELPKLCKTIDNNYNNYMGYVGETKRKLVDEHSRAVRMADFNSSALAEHAWSAGHNVDITILDQHENLHAHEALAGSEECHLREATPQQRQGLPCTNELIVTPTLLMIAV